jgi:NTP pyrophosphatase (non-canonical NTP hydrolase)
MICMLNRGFSLTDLQEYIKSKDFNPDQGVNYFYKLIEEVGELSEVLRKNKRMIDSGSIKGTIEEELYDVLYYVVAIANIHNINLEECTFKKEELNNEKWKTRIKTF